MPPGDFFAAGQGWPALIALTIVGALVGIRQFISTKRIVREDAEDTYVGLGYHELIKHLRDETKRAHSRIADLELVQRANEDLRSRIKDLEHENAGQQRMIDELRLEVTKLENAP